MKQDRKRLKGEKVDLLNQMKQLYCTLESKEEEMRDFLRNYEQRVSESDENLNKIIAEKEEVEKDRLALPIYLYFLGYLSSVEIMYNVIDWKEKFQIYMLKIWYSKAKWTKGVRSDTNNILNFFM